VTPAELAREAPRLYHVTSPDAADAILRDGLLCTESLVHASTVGAAQREALLQQRRAAEVPLTLHDGRTVRLNDNLPLSMKALAVCLDDGWQPVQWLMHLNRHVFFWPSEKRLASLLHARMNRERERAVLVFDTQSLLSAHADRACLSPINSGAAMRRAARRGAGTFAPIGDHSFAQWRRLRGKRDDIAEVVIRGDVPDAARHLVEVRRYCGGTLVQV
jgi:hypothetical protein